MILLLPFWQVNPFHPGLHPNSQVPFKLLQLLQFWSHLLVQFGPCEPGRQAINVKLLTMKSRSRSFVFALHILHVHCDSTYNQ